MQHPGNTGPARQRVLGRILAQNFSAEEQRAMQTAAAGAIGPPAATAQIVKTAPYYFTDSITDDHGHAVR